MGSCEETKMHDIIAFNEENEAPDFCMVPDASFPVCFCEKGLMGVDILAGKPFESIKSISGGIMTNAVAGKAEARFEYSDRMKNALERMCAENTRLALTQEGQELVLTAVGVTAHAANPQGSTNAIFILCKELYLCPEISEQDKEILEAAATAIGDYYGEGIGIDAEHPQTGRLTSVCGLAATADGKLKLTFDIRICTASSREAVESGFEKFCKAWGWELLRCTFSEGYYIDPEGPQVKALLDTYKEITGDVSAKPYFMGGGTYARHLKNALPFGLSFKNRPEGLPAGHGKEHQPDEAFKTEDLIKAIKIYILAAVELDRVLNK